MAELRMEDCTIVFMSAEEVVGYNETNPFKRIQLPCNNHLNPDWIKKFCLGPMGYMVLMDDKRKLPPERKFHKPVMMLYSELISLILESEIREQPFNQKSLHFSNTCGAVLMEWFVKRPTAIPPFFCHSLYETQYIISEAGGLAAFLRVHCNKEFFYEQ